VLFHRTAIDSYQQETDQYVYVSKKVSKQVSESK